MNRFEGLSKPSMVTSGVLLVLGSVLRQFHEYDPRSAVTVAPLFLAGSLVLLAGALLLELALVALYVRRAPQVGSLGFAAAIVAGAGTILLCARYWSEVFLAPAAALVAPELIDEVAAVTPVRFGLILTHAVFGTGWVLAGAALLHAHVYGHVASIGMIAGGALSLMPFTSLGQLVLGLSIVWLGFTPAYARPERYRRARPAA